MFPKKKPASAVFIVWAVSVDREKGTVMAEVIATLAVAGYVVAVAIGIGYFVMLLYRD